MTPIPIQVRGGRELLENAWKLRERLRAFENNQAVRVFYGPGEGLGEWAWLAIDCLGDFAWVTEWEPEKGRSSGITSRTREEVASFLKEKGVQGAVWLGRPHGDLPHFPEVFFGKVPSEEIEIQEEGLKIGIRLQETRHPGLFLDHLPLRRWLKKNMKGKRVLNTFAYTGSLSLAAGAGGAASVTTLDLSKPTIRWAEQNWERNRFEGIEARFIYGDVFEWLPRLKRDGKAFDCVISDPPSFSRGKKGNFSTSKDLAKLHALLFEVLEPGGWLVSSINSAQVPYAKMEAQIVTAARAQGRRLRVVEKIDLPDTFPTRDGDFEARYLKGVIARIG